MSDLISRSALLKSIWEVSTSPLNEWDTIGVLNIVNKQPTVEAKEVVHGEWKEATPKGVHSWSKGYARCSACDETIWSGWEMNFCPNCGCDMRTSAE